MVSSGTGSSMGSYPIDKEKQELLLKLMNDILKEPNPQYLGSYFQLLARHTLENIGGH